MSAHIVPFDPDAVCENCGGKGALDFMGDNFCPSCLKMCAKCGELFVINLIVPKTMQKYCWDCGSECPV